MNGILIATLVVLVISAVIGYFRGFIRIVVSLATTVATIALVIFLNPYVSDLITKYTPLDEMVQSKVTSAISAGLTGGSSSEDGSENGSEDEASGDGISGIDWSGIDLSGTDLEGKDLSGYSVADLKELGITQEQINQVLESAQISKADQTNYIEGSGLPSVLQNLLKENNNTEAYQKLGVDTFGAYVGKYLAKIVINIVGFLLTFLLATILIRAVVFALSIVENLPVVGGANRAAGAVMGVVITILLVWIFDMIIMLLYNTSIGKTCITQIEANTFLSFLYQHNVLMNMVVAFR